MGGDLEVVGSQNSLWWKGFGLVLCEYRLQMPKIDGMPSKENVGKVSIY
jgi:hypothetical protein